ncbi:MAG: hypothetical protein P1U72_20480 [Paracoccaceae bacterium]|nr:hypothetical protein [Paracoccaceae bacterium]
MAVKERNYEAAKIVLWILGSIAWLQILIGALGILSGGFGAGYQLGMSLTIMSAVTLISGLVSLALVQMASANVHTAEINWEMLQIMRGSSSAGNTTSAYAPSGNAAPRVAAPSSGRVYEFDGNRLPEGASFDVVGANGDKRQAWRLGDGRVVIRTVAGSFKAFDSMEDLKAYIS